MAPNTQIPDPAADPGLADGPVWYRLGPVEACAAAVVDPASGLGPGEVEERRRRHGPNRLAEPPVRPRWKKFLDQFRSGIVLILAVAAVVAGAVGDLKDTVVIAVVLFINAVLGYLQEAKAETALAALEGDAGGDGARPPGGGERQEVAADDLVPGDIVLLEPGDRVPADGRLLVAAGLSIDESALTGESVPVDKWAEPIEVEHGLDRLAR